MNKKNIQNKKEKPKTMSTETAFGIIYAIAERYIRHLKTLPGACKLEKVKEYKEALDVAHDFLVNNIFE